MAKMQNNNDEKNNELIVYLAQYNSLRSEIVERVKMHHQLIILLFASAATITSLALTDTGNTIHLLLILPIIIAFIGGASRRNSARISQLGFYIKYKIETPLKEKKYMPPEWEGWDTYQEDSEKKGGPNYIKNTIARLFMRWHLLAIFVGLQIVSIALFYIFENPKMFDFKFILVICDIVITLYTAVAFFTNYSVNLRRKRVAKRIKK